MRGPVRTFWSVAIFGVLTTPGATAASPQIWELGVHGGGGADDTYQSIYEIAKDRYAAINSFAIPRDHRTELFGPQVGPPCYAEDRAPGAANAEKAFLSAKDCRLAQPIFDFMEGTDKLHLVCSDAKHNLRDLDGSGHPDVTAPATAGAITQTLTRLVKEMPRGSHLTLDLNGPGEITKSNPPDWQIALGDRFGKISVKDLEPYFKDLRAKGVSIHLDVQGCFGGGFAALSGGGQTPGEGVVCTTSMTQKNLSGYNADSYLPKTYSSVYYGNMRKFGSQLKAFSCSLAQDAVNHPMTSLDNIVADWESSRPTPPAACEPVTSLAEVEKQVRAFRALVSDGGDARDRQALIELFQKDVASVFSSCLADRDEPTEFMDRLKTCVDDPSINLGDESARGYFKAWLGQERSKDYDLSLMNRHLRFLRDASTADLQKYKAALCCLDFDFKTREAPALCASGS